MGRALFRGYNGSMSVEGALQALRIEPRFSRNVIRWEEVPARAARYAPFPRELDGRLISALAARGIDQLYTHQAAAIHAALAGEHVAVVTSPASGKTLCYNLPVLQRLLADPASCALYLFPTKALAQDQLAELRELVTPLAGPPLQVAVYDGDTPPAQRGRIRSSARIVLSNPDMLHVGILPQHPRWAVFFANLRTVVIDEMHVYRGVFGSHMANVLRRLRRICHFYGADPHFILASATIGNPAELAQRLIEAPVRVIGPDLDGAPRGPRHVIFYNPPLLDPVLGIRRSSSQEAAELAAHFLAHGVQTIVFARARLTTELILTYLRGLAATTDPHDLPLIRGYRGGYLPSERRAIEKGLREGRVHAVVATNALELGIDIGQLEAALLAGYPGTVASTWQQIGRAGRRQSAAVALLIAGPDALDQYIITHPDYLLARNPEHALVNPDNEVILSAHLACAAAELPLAVDEGFGGQPASSLLSKLAEAGQLYRAGGRFYWAGRGSPAAAISLRASSADRVLIQVCDAVGQPQVIGELDRSSVPLLLYEGAIYFHEGVTYRVERLDWAAGLAIVRPVDVDYYTLPTLSEQIEVLRVQEVALKPEAPRSNAPSSCPDMGWPPADFALAWGDVRVVTQANGYKILRRGTHEVLGFGPIELPPQEVETQACWLVLSPELVESLRQASAWFSDPNDYGPEWPAQRDAARARDGYRCQWCGAAEQPGRQHDVHHKIPLRAFVADPRLRQGLPPELAWQAANRLDNLVTLCPSCHRRAEMAVRLRSGLSGVAALLRGVAPLHLMCDPHDLGMVIEPVAGAPAAAISLTGPTITFYDRAPGGVGYAAHMFRVMPELLQAAYEVATGCLCERGCPACVGPVLEHEYALDAKALAIALLERLWSGRTQQLDAARPHRGQA